MGYRMKPGNYSEKPKNTENEYFGNGWSVRNENGRFLFAFISGELQGAARETEISAEDYELARSGAITFDELCIRYNVS